MFSESIIDIYFLVLNTDMFHDKQLYLVSV